MKKLLVLFLLFINSNVMSMECMVFNHTERTMTMKSYDGEYTLEKGKSASILLPLRVCQNVLRLVLDKHSTIIDIAKKDYIHVPVVNGHDGQEQVDVRFNDDMTVRQWEIKVADTPNTSKLDDSTSSIKDQGE